MTIITIRELPTPPGAGPNAVVTFDHGPQHPIRLSDPFDPDAEARLAWYFEAHLERPYMNQVAARQAAESIFDYGEALFAQVFSGTALEEYYPVRTQGLDRLLIEIEGSPEFHHYHWEALKDPRLPRPFAVDVPVVRKNLTPQAVPARVRPSPALNVLLVTSRPFGEGDVAYRTISRPLVEGLRQAGIPVRVDLLRPATYRGLCDHLEACRDASGAGFYHIIHFDVHGSLLEYGQLQQAAAANGFVYNARYGRADLAPYPGQKAFLFLDGEAGGPADAVEAGELAQLLTTQQAPVVILNACQSGQQKGASETSLASRLVAAGVQVALGMRYSITVSAARLLMTTLYRQLFAGCELPAAVRRARYELHQQKGRKAYYSQTIDLEDWLLPVVYQNRGVALQLRPFTPDEEQGFFEAQGRAYPFPEPAYGFVGRDLDILAIERRVLRGERTNLLLVQGMGGAGKTTLLKHLAAWWQSTHFVQAVFYFGYDEKAHTLTQILHTLARALLGEAEYRSRFAPLSPAAGQAFVLQRLRSARHLLILDNLESITGSHLAVGNTLPEGEQRALKGFLAALLGGQSLVLLGSRGPERWLQTGEAGQAAALAEEALYPLGGLDPEAASDLAERIFTRLGIARERQDPALARLLALLAGFPLALEVVLPNLKRQAPGEVLAALQGGDPGLDPAAAGSQPLLAAKTSSILRCIEYSYSNLDPAAQALLACLAPFSGVVDGRFLPQYTEKLAAQPALAGLPFDRWQEVLAAAAEWGLLGPDPELPFYLRLQPVLPYFLRAWLGRPERAAVRAAIETAYRRHYDELGGALSGLLESKEAQKKQLGQLFTRHEYENLLTALRLALAAQVSVQNPYFALSSFLSAMQDHARGLALGEEVFAQMQGYPPEALSGDLGAEMAMVLDKIANRNLELQRYELAGHLYQKNLKLLAGLTGQEADWIASATASTYHQLGRVAQEQRQWAQAESYYQQALQIKIEYNDRYSQANTYHQLGMVAEEQRQWAQAESYYQQALQIYIEYNDRYSQAGTYHQLGRVAQAQRQWAQAESYYQQALQIYIEYNDRYEQAGTYHNLGAVAQEQRQWAQAESYYQQALQLFIEYNDRHGQARIYHAWGRVAEEQEQWAEARAYYLQALTTFTEYHDDHATGITLRSLARLWRAGGDPELPQAVGAVLGILPAEARQRLEEAG